MAAHLLSDTSAKKLQEHIDAATADPTTQIPGFVACIVNKDGRTIFSHASGKRGVNSSDPMTLESVFWIASCTKMIGGIICMQLVEQGKLSLDDADLAEKLCPELKEVRILKDGKLVEKKNRITLRHLLSHTSGYGYTFFSHEIREFGLPEGLDEFSGLLSDIKQPLSFEPGTNWQYGVGIDWAGVMAERATDRSLNELMQDQVFKPLNIKNISMFPNADMKSRLVFLHSRHPETGKLTVREHINHRPLVVEPGSAEEKSTLNSAGAGCFAQPSEYTKIIATLLNDGTDPVTKNQILKPATVAEMFSNQIEHLPNFARAGIPAAKSEYTNPLPDLYPQGDDVPQGWGLTFMITIKEGVTGRGRNTAWWAGLPNLFWWADRANGVGGIVASQIIPFADAKVLGLWFEVEKAIYEG